MMEMLVGRCLAPLPGVRAATGDVSHVPGKHRRRRSSNLSFAASRLVFYKQKTTSERIIRILYQLSPFTEVVGQGNKRAVGLSKS